jgi:hypothetical protein
MIQFTTLPIRTWLNRVGQNPFNSDILEYIEGLRAVGMILDLEYGPWIAGGCLEALASGRNLEKRDIDIFYARHNERHHNFFDLNNVLEAPGYEFNNTFWESYAGEHSDTRKVVLNGKPLHIQRINKTYYNSAANIFGDFDFTVCQIATDGKNVFTTEQAIKDLKSKTLRITRLKTESNTLPRIVKYTMDYGYTLAPGHLQRIHEIIKGREHAYSKGSNS